MNTITDEEYMDFRDNSTIGQMYIVQRGTFNRNIVNDGGLTLTGRNGIIDLDYMGAAEYEFGAVPYSYRRIMSQIENFQMFITDIKTVNEVPIWVYCHKNNYLDILKELHLYLNETNPNLIVRYILHEYIGFADKINAKHRERSFWHTNDNFWWDLHNDFMFFVGASDRSKLVENAIHDDYNTWWMMKDESDRNKLLEEAHRRW